jgi:hypothetical protein
MRLCLALIVSGIIATHASADDAKPSKPTSHTQREIEGWTVQIDDRLLSGDDAALGERGQRILANRLYDIKLVVPADKVKRLQQVTIWLDHSYGELKSAQYHPNANWLREHGYSEQLAKSVHIPDAAYFFSPRHLNEQPWAVMHELAHAYHDQVLDFEHPQIKDAWQRFKDSRRYTLVTHIDGRQRPHYALTNQKEFFAEMTESYFGMNDFFPFNRVELKQEEPEVFQLLQDLWGPLP